MPASKKRPSKTQAKGGLTKTAPVSSTGHRQRRPNIHQISCGVRGGPARFRRRRYRALFGARDIARRFDRRHRARQCQPRNTGPCQGRIGGAYQERARVGRLVVSRRLVVHHHRPSQRARQAASGMQDERDCRRDRASGTTACESWLHGRSVASAAKLGEEVRPIPMSACFLAEIRQSIEAGAHQ